MAEAIAAGIGNVSGQRILLPRADIARKALAEALRGGGAAVEEMAAYRTLPASPIRGSCDELREGVDVITFTSSSTVRYFVELLGEAGPLRSRRADRLYRADHGGDGPGTRFDRRPGREGIHDRRAGGSARGLLSPFSRKHLKCDGTMIPEEKKTAQIFEPNPGGFSHLPPAPAAAIRADARHGAGDQTDPA